MTTITSKKNDGSPIQFNLQLENGLPLKPIIEPDYVGKQNKDSTKTAIFTEFSKKEIEQANNLALLDSYWIHNELWLDYGNCYVVFTNLSDIIIEAVQKKTLTIYFLNEEQKIISSQSAK